MFPRVDLIKLIILTPSSKTFLKGTGVFVLRLFWQRRAPWLLAHGACAPTPVKHPQLPPRLLLLHCQCRRPPSGEGKGCFSIIMKVVSTSQPPGERLSTTDPTLRNTGVWSLPSTSELKGILGIIWCRAPKGGTVSEHQSLWSACLKCVGPTPNFLN